MPRILRTSVAGSLLVVVACWCVYAQSSATKITRIKLGDYGWQPAPNKGDYSAHRGPFSRNLWLDHKGRILVGFTVRENYALATREHPGRSFHILRFTAEGRLDLSSVLPAKEWYSNGFYLGPDDQIFARADDTLQMFSEGESQKEGDLWQPLAPCPQKCFISQSFSRRTLILRVEPLVGGPDRSTYTILDASSSAPRVVRTCSQMALYARHITDRFAYWGNYDRDDHLMVRYAFCELERYEEFPMWGRGGGYVLNDETLLKIDVKGAVLLGPDGEVKFSVKMPKNDSLNPYEMATDDRFDRFAYMVNTDRGAHPGLDTGGHLVGRRVVVYSDSGQELASIPTDTHYHIDSDFSMSPDGHRLAILDDGVVTTVELP